MTSRTLLTLFGLTLALPAYAQTDHPGPFYLGGLKHERLVTSTVPALSLIHISEPTRPY